MAKVRQIPKSLKASQKKAVCLNADRFQAESLALDCQLRDPCLWEEMYCCCYIRPFINAQILPIPRILHLKYCLDCQGTS
jgi:hypothetical protein